MTDLRYPIGEFVWPAASDAARRAEYIGAIEQLPARLREAVSGLTDAQLDTPYRLGGWTVRQVVHHVADSHINAYVRFRFTLTEDLPALKGYNEALWAEIADARSGPVEVSLTLLDSLHRRWVMMLRSLTAVQFERAFHHSELGQVTLDRNLALYAWHGAHHTAHVASLRERMGWGV
jgi:uncharacterized damage-inducible protein DinB